MAKAKDKENPERYYVWDENKEEKESCSLSKIYLLFIDQIQDMNEDMRKRLQNNIKKLKYLKVEQKNIDDLVRDLP